MNITIANANLTQFIRSVINNDEVMIRSPERIKIVDIQPRLNNIMSKKNGDDPCSSQFEYKGGHGEKVVVQTTSSTLFNQFQDGEVPVGGVCTYHLGTFDWNIYCYPVKHKIIRATELNEYGELVYFTRHQFARDDNIFCGFSCALTYLDMLCSGRSYESSHAEQSRVLLLREFEIRFPGQKLRPAKDKRLLKINRGHMDYDEWNSSNYTLFPTNFIINIPTKQGYVMRTERVETKTLPVTSPLKAVTQGNVIPKKTSAFGNFASQIQAKGNFNPLRMIPKTQ